MPSARTILVHAVITLGVVFLINRFADGGIVAFGQPPKPKLPTK